MKTVALCIGHSRFINGKRDGGAVSVGNVNEWTYNSELADMIQGRLENMGIASKVYDEYVGVGYTAAMKWVATQLDKDNVDAAVELHFNSAGADATGHEWLYWHSSQKGFALASKADHEMRRLIPGFKARGCKPLSSGSRGAEFCRLTPCPAIITEPFFGSNKADWDIAVNNKEEIAEAIALSLAQVKEW